MRTTITTTARTVFFPDACRTWPSIADPQAVVDWIHPSALLVFATRLVRPGALCDAEG